MSDPSPGKGRPPAASPREEDPPIAGLTDQAIFNRASWNADADDYQARNAPFIEAHGGMAWGVWQIPESELRILGDVAGRDVLELGCGAAQWSIALARAGARPVGLDLSDRQLDHARRLMAEAGVDFPLVHASAEAVPLPDETFDIVFCDHGAMSFADPYLTVPEVARLVRPGGLFAFSHASAFIDLTWPEEAERASDRLTRDYFGMHRLEYSDEIAFQLPYGEWIRLFRANGFEVLDLIEPRPAADATSSYRDEMERDWSRRWPAESIWRLRRVGAA